VKFTDNCNNELVLTRTTVCNLQTMSEQWEVQSLASAVSCDIKVQDETAKLRTAKQVPFLVVQMGGDMSTMTGASHSVVNICPSSYTISYIPSELNTCCFGSSLWGCAVPEDVLLNLFAATAAACLSST